MSPASLPPHSLEMEKATLGGLIADPRQIENIALTPSDFFQLEHAAVFAAIVEVIRERNALDSALLHERLRDGRQLEQVGGLDYLTELVESVPILANVPAYAAIVKQKADERRTRDAALKIVEAIDAGNPDLARSAVDELNQTSPSVYVYGTPSSGGILRVPLTRGGGIEPFIPFPVDALPEPAGSFVAHSASAIGCDESFIALPLLVGLASAIGNTRRIELKRGFTLPSVLWGALVGESGSLKSPSLELPLRPVHQRQHVALTRHAEAMELHRSELMEYEQRLTNWKKRGSGDPPQKPEEPAAERYWCDDATVEVMAVILKENWRGLLSIRDELAGWIGSFDRYAGGAGGDVARWLEMFDGRAMVVDRKGGTPRTLSVPRAAVSLVGGIQPQTLRRALSNEYRENGLAARLLMTCPPRRPRQWTEAEVDPRQEAAIAAIYDRLYSLQPSIGADGEPYPVNVPLTPAGKAAWVEFFNIHGQEYTMLSGDMAAAWSKLEGYAGRLALVVHFIRWAANDPTLADPNAIDEMSIGAGVTLSDWFANEARRIYSILAETDAGRQRRELVELIQRRGGEVTARELQQNSRRYKGCAELAERALLDLVRSGFGSWVDFPATGAGGRPTRAFRLNSALPVNETPLNQPGNTGSVDVDTPGDSTLTDGGEV